MELLVEKQADVNLTNATGETALHLAVEISKGSGEESLQLVKFLVERWGQVKRCFFPVGPIWRRLTTAAGLPS